MSSGGPKLPAIPSVSSALPPDMRQFVDAVRQILQVQLAQTPNGSPLDATVTFRDLQNASGISISFPVDPVTGTSTPTINAGSPAELNFTPPPAPTTVTASGSLTSIFISFDSPTYSNHSFAEIWRQPVALDGGGNPIASDLGSATLCGTVNGYATLYPDPVGTSGDYWYWVRFVSAAAVKGPFNAVSGVRGQTSASPTYLLSVLNAAITSSQLASTLSTRIDLIDAADTVAGSVAYRVAAESAARSTAISTINSTLGDIASDDKLTPLEKSFVRTEWDVIAAEKSVLNSQASTFSITTENTTYNTKFQALADYLNAGTWTSGIPSWISDANLSTTTTIVGATFRTKFKEYYDARTALLNAIATKAKTLADTAQSTANSTASTVSTLSTTVSGHTSSISAHTTSIDGLNAMYSVKIDNNGVMSGFGLSSTIIGGGSITSKFLASVDNFGITAPVTSSATEPGTKFVGMLWKNTSGGTINGVAAGATGRWNGTAWTAQGFSAMPFAVLTTTQTINGVTFNPGVYMDGAMINNGTITANAIAAGTITADKITSGTITATQIASATITATQIAANTITASKIAAGTITAAEIAASTITAAKLATKTITAASGVIDDLAVDTLQLAGNAVTIPVGVSSATPVDITSTSPQTVLTASITSTGAPICIAAAVTGYSGSNSQTGYDVNLRMDIACDGTSIAGPILVVSNATLANNIATTGSTAIVVVHTPGSGSHTYTMRMWYDATSYINTSDKPKFNFGGLTLLEVKK